MRAPSWLWPTTRREDATALVRLGRVLHWLLTGVGAALLLIAAVMAISSPAGAQANSTELNKPMTSEELATARQKATAPNYFDRYDQAAPAARPAQPRRGGIAAAISLLPTALLLLILGRAARYVLAGE